MIRQGGVYQIVNTENGKRYIGSAKCFHVRKGKHLSALGIGNHHAKHLQAAFRKYGSDVFSFNILLVCSPEDLLFYEQRAIDRLQPEYNSSPTAGNTLGVRCDPERRRKISVAHTGKVLTEEHRRSISLGNMGRTPSEETRIKLVAAAQGRAKDPEWRRKVSEGKLGKPLSEEHKAALSNAKKGVPANLSEEARLSKNKKIGEANRVRTISDACRRNMGAAQRTCARVERFEFEGEMFTVLDLAEKFGVDRHVLRKRLNAGWDIARAVTQPTKVLRRHGND